MFSKLSAFTHKYQLVIGIFGFFLTITYYLLSSGEMTLTRSLPQGFSWFCVFLVGDWLNRKIGNGSLFPHNINRTNKFKKLILAAFMTSLIIDFSGAWSLRLWFYPNFESLSLYFLLFAPIGFILYGLILLVFYKLIKNTWDTEVKPGRLSNAKRYLYGVIVHLQLILGITGLVFSYTYYQNYIIQNNIILTQINQLKDAPVNIIYLLISWVSLFFLLEFICYWTNKETFTRDIIRGNFLPLIAILLSSFLCIALIEFFNTPLQTWVFTNWPKPEHSFMAIPLTAYILWPLQYLILLPLVRIFDGGNTENVW